MNMLRFVGNLKLYQLQQSVGIKLLTFTDFAHRVISMIFYGHSIPTNNSSWENLRPPMQELLNS